MYMTAAQAGVSRSLIWRIDNHQMGQPLLDTYIKLGRCYETVLGRAPPSLKFR